MSPLTDMEWAELREIEADPDRPAAQYRNALTRLLAEHEALCVAVSRASRMAISIQRPRPISHVPDGSEGKHGR